MAAPRQENPRPLNAALVPLEQALLHRAEVLDQQPGTVVKAVAGELRALAEELHHWL